MSDNRGRIIVRSEYPPIPQRNFDWRAFHEGDEECPARHGWGASADEALADLSRLDAERADEDELRRRDVAEGFDK
jgi:hypothetical protein